jgi:hypothetical protein
MGTCLTSSDTTDLHYPKMSAPSKKIPEIEKTGKNLPDFNKITLENLNKNP